MGKQFVHLRPNRVSSVVTAASVAGAVAARKTGTDFTSYCSPGNDCLLKKARFTVELLFASSSRALGKTNFRDPHFRVLVSFFVANCSWLG